MCSRATADRHSTGRVVEIFVGFFRRGKWSRARGNPVVGCLVGA